MKKHNAHSLTAAHLYTETLLSSWLGCRCLRFWSTLGNVFLLFTAFTIHVGESRAPRTVVPRSTFGGSKRSILQFPNGISPDDEVFPSPMGCSFWTVCSSPVSFSRFVLNVIQLFAPIIFTWFSLIFNDSCVFILFKSLPYCKCVFHKCFCGELNWTTVTTTNAMEPPEDVIVVVILFSLMKACKVGMLYLYRAQSGISLAFIEK